MEDSVANKILFMIVIIIFILMIVSLYTIAKLNIYDRVVKRLQDNTSNLSTGHLILLAIAVMIVTFMVSLIFGRTRIRRRYLIIRTKNSAE